MSQDNLVKLKSTAKGGRIVWTRKNRKKLANNKLELMKYDPTVRKRVLHKEVKK